MVLIYERLEFKLNFKFFSVCVWIGFLKSHALFQ